MIQEYIKAIVGESSPNIIAGKVISIDVDLRVCDVEPANGDATLFDVRIQSYEGLDNGFWLLPEVGSYVLVGLLAETAGVVLATSVVSKMEVVVKDHSLVIDESGLSLSNKSTSLLSEILAFSGVVAQLVDTLLNFQLATNVGPTISVMPQIVTMLNQHKADLSKFEQNFKTLCH